MCRRGILGPMPSRDHVVPQSKGGRQWIIACVPCNTIKADMLPERWAAFMERNPGWWLMSRRDLRMARRALPLDATGTLVLPARVLPRRQGSPRPRPVVVPPELIFGPSALRAARDMQRMVEAWTTDLDGSIRKESE